MVSLVIQIAVSTSLIVGGLTFAVAAGVPDLCNTLSGYCLASLAWAQPIPGISGTVVATTGFLVLFRALKRKAGGISSPN